jgi:hypothetical protein
MRLGETCCGGSEETGELGAVEASGGVDGWDGDVEVENGDVEVHSVSLPRFFAVESRVYPMFYEELLG